MIKVGLTEMHGIAKEIAEFPPEEVTYVPIQPRKHFTDRIFTSTAKGVLSFFSSSEVDIIEAPLFPILTHQKWIYTPADMPTACNFQVAHLPLPRKLRIFILKKIFFRDNFVRLLFKSKAGKGTLKTYAKVGDDFLPGKIDVVYPPVRRVNDQLIKFSKQRINILFVGDFFAKGGVHVVEAFEIIQKEFPDTYLRICSLDTFRMHNAKLAKIYWQKIQENPQIKFGYVERERLLREILPDTDIFVCPTYADSYGYAIEEAMAFGIPVISTDIFAIPEIVNHNVTGFLIKVQGFEFIKKFKNYTVDKLPNHFFEYMNQEVYKYLRLLISNFDLRRTMGMAGLKRARTKFSFKNRNRIMKKIYEAAVSDGAV